MRNRFCRHLALLLALTGLSLGNAFAALPGPGATYTLAVLPLEASGRITTDEANMLTERLSMELEKTGIFIATPQSTIAAILPNGGTGCSTKECAIQAGRQLSAQLVVNGSVRKVGQIYFVETQLIHIKSGKMVEHVSQDFDGDFEQLQSVMATVARKLVGKSLFNGNMANTATGSSSRELTSTQHSGGGTSGTTNYRNGGNKVLIYSLVAVGAVGATVGITQLTKGSDDKNNNKPTTGTNLPNPPSFP